MSRKDLIRQKIEEALNVAALEIVDESHLHAGHAGARPEGESHFRITLVSSDFEGRSRLERQRVVNDILAEELKGAIHALSHHTNRIYLECKSRGLNIEECTYGFSIAVVLVRNSILPPTSHEISPMPISFGLPFS